VREASCDGVLIVNVFTPPTVELNVHVRTPDDVFTELLQVVVALVPEVIVAVVAVFAITALSVSFTVIVHVTEVTPVASPHTKDE
jgi:hypothetical protein